MTTRRARPDAAAIAAALGAPADELGPAAAAAVADLLDEIETLKARLAEAEGLADRDALTPLLNRRALVRELERASAYVRRYGAPASLVYFDVDGLKAVNDRHGHPAGDAVLQAVAQRLLGQVRATDVVGRMGGDEFAVILVQTDGFQAEAKARALAAAVAAPIALGGAALRVSVAWGVAEVRAGLAAEAIIAEADAAMYADKRTRLHG